MKGAVHLLRRGTPATAAAAAAAAAAATVACRALFAWDTRPVSSRTAFAVVNDVRDRTYFITGATDGIGEHTAMKLAKLGATVAVHGRNKQKVDRVVERLRKAGSTKATGFVADLSVLSEVRALGKRVAAEFPVIDGLANNAGTFDGDYTGRYKQSADGNEYTLAVNVLAPFVLTSILLPCVRRSKQGRILVTSSISQGCADGLDDLQLKRRWSGHRAYSLSKLCDAMIVFELHEKYGDPPKLTVNTMDPGTVNTKMLLSGWGACGIPVSSADNTFNLLTREDLSNTSGKYFCGSAPSSPMVEVRDPKCRQKLWQDLTKLTGTKWPQ